MVGMMATNTREKTASLLNSIKLGTNKPLRLEHLSQLKVLLLHNDPSLLSEFITDLLELHTDRFSPIRKSLAKIIGEIGSMYTEFIPEIVPVLMSFLKDGTPPVARQAITSGTDLFHSTLEKVAVKGLYTSELDDSLESSWGWMLKFKDTLYPIAFQRGSDGIRLLAVKFVEAIILLYTPDPNGSAEPPPDQSSEGKIAGFNISWLRGGHPVLNVGNLSIEASQSLGLLLDQLRFPTVKSLSNLTVIVLINSLSTIANKRPAFYGRILPVLLGLDPSSSVVKGLRGTGVHHSLKKAFLSCLECTHPCAAPWRDRLVGAMKDIKSEDLAEQAFPKVVRITGSSETGTCESHPTEEEKPLMKACDSAHESGRKRSVIQEISDLEHNDNASGKRAKPTPIISERAPVNRDINPNLGQGNPPLIGKTSSTGDGETGPVQQLVAMFGALVAQGDKAAGSLEILISSISADLLAEVVMANMRRLPPEVEEDEELMLNMGSLSNIAGTNTLATLLTSLVSDIPSLSTVFPQVASLLPSQSSAIEDISKHHLADEHQAVAVSEIASVCASRNDATTVGVPISATLPCTVVDPIGARNGSAAIPSDMHDMETMGSGIPGLDSTVCDDAMPENLDVAHLTNIDLGAANSEQVTSSDGSVLLDFPSSVSISADRSEEFGLKVATSDSVVSTSTPVVLSSQYILPKISAPVIDLTDEEKDHIQRSAFMRIIEAYKQISIAGGSDVRFSLLACLGVEYPLELDAWKLLQKHILSDYLNYEGHELTLRVLYRLFGEAEKENDFFSSTTATSVYETFLLTVAETLRDSFPASDKSLSKLLGEVPYLPRPAFKLLESLCSPGSKEKIDKELQSGDRVTQGLSAVWNLILQRPPIRDVCLKIALQSAVHQLEEVRMKAIRLVANKLYPISSIAQKIEDFAGEMLLSVTKDHTVEGVDAQGSITEVQKETDLEKPSEQLLANTGTKDISSDTHQSCSTSSTTTSLISEAQRCMSLYFALCTKKHSLFRQIFVIYESIPKAVTEAVHRHIPILVRTIGSSHELLAIISDPPTGCESLLMQVLHILTDGTIPSPELVFTVRKLYDSKLKDVGILIPILSSLPKDEVLPIFPKLVNLQPDKFQSSLARMLQGSPHSSLVLSPAEVLIAIHGIDPDKDDIPLKKVTDACNACFEQRQVFTQQVLAKVLNQLVEQIPLPLLFMRTVLQAIGAFPALVDFIMEILSRLVTKQIWKYPKLWVGFLKCAILTKPQSFGVLLQLPAAQLENALNRTAAPIKAPLIAHADQPSVRSSLPRSTLVVLGLAQDSLASSQTQKSPNQTAETSNTVSGTEGVIEKTKESSSVS